MRPLLQHASRTISVNATPIARQSSIRPFTSFLKREPSICLRCQFRSLVFPSSAQLVSRNSDLPRRYFHQTPNDERKPFDENKSPTDPLEDSSSDPKTPFNPSEPIRIEPSPTTVKEQNKEIRSLPDGTVQEKLAAPNKEEVVDNIDRVPAEKLPSHRESQQWNFHKRLNDLMDELLPKLADVTQKVNTYTGTDYSGIQALKREIKEQEKLVKARRAVIEEAKQALDAAHSQAAASQKEVVALLERKHSWSATDLERYMSLIRSEHVNDQAVREAKEAITAAENALEEARAQLEKRERAQYHEEQIWSDTIRRNSTWVTFGLMGVNILLLLLSLLIFEPWRRRRMVREIKAALEAHKSSMEPILNPLLQAPIPAAIAETEAEKIKEVEPAPATSEHIINAVSHDDNDDGSPVPEKLEMASEEPLQSQGATPEHSLVTADIVPEATPLTSTGVSSEDTINTEKVVEDETKLPPLPDTWQNKVVSIAKDIVSEREISMRRLDFTNAIISSAAAGAIIAAAIVGLLTPR